VSDKDPFGYDSLKLRAIFIPEGNPENITAADITNHVGYDSLRLRAVLIPDGNPDNVSPADITNWLGYDVVRVRYSWGGSGEGQPEQEQEPPAEGADGGERAAAAIQGADGPGSTPVAQPAASAMPPTPTLAQAARYADPAKTAAAAWRAIAALSPPSQPAVSHGADGQGGTVARPDAGSGEPAGSSGLDAYVSNDRQNATDPGRLFTNVGTGVAAGLLGKGGSGSIVQTSADEAERNPESPENVQQQERRVVQSPVGPGAAPGSTIPGTSALPIGPLSGSPSADATPSARNLNQINQGQQDKHVEGTRPCGQTGPDTWAVGKAWAARHPRGYGGDEPIG
jgi:hypothetical protein